MTLRTPDGPVRNRLHYLGRDPFFEPFDVTYAEVTRRIDSHAAALDLPMHAWLNALTADFQAERQLWEWDPAYEPYLDSCARLRPRILRLAAGAYLHISYDLPRVIANNWPGHGRWTTRPSTEEAEWTYLDLNPIFFEVFTKVARYYEVGGAFSLLFRMLPGNATAALAHWAMHLRTASWIHAQRLARDSSGRHFREAMMLKAMVALVSRSSAAAEGPDITYAGWIAAVNLLLE